jgi:endonuclease/exonuclease/phosphatase family metal-dependent hydrolase
MLAKIKPLFVAFLAIFVVLGIALPAEAQPIKIATWNIEHLRAEVNRGPNPRTDADFERLSDYVDVLNADIIALQEVDGPDAAARVFDPGEYNFYFSETNNPQNTGFAIRNTLQVTQNPDLDAINLDGNLRDGADVTVKVGDRDIRFLSVHLKSQCFDAPLNSQDRDCQKLSGQVPILENWIDELAQSDLPLVVMGDFNRRFNRDADEFWLEIDDGVPANADLVKVTEGRISQCWDGEFPEYIDHIVLDRQSSAWVVDGSFEQILYAEPIAEQGKLSDHCPLAVALNVPTVDSTSTSEENATQPASPTTPEWLESIRQQWENFSSRFRS